LLLHGVDFSGAESGGAAKIRMVTRDLAAPRSPLLSRGRMDRHLLLRSLQELAQDGRSHLVRIDAPFGLPLETLRRAGVEPSWSAMSAWLASFGSPRAWRSELRASDRREPRRVCDEAFRTPMAPMNLRVFKQTWTLIAEVLRPLAERGVRVEPVHAAADASLTVCEGCPASVLKLLGWPDHGYKGQGEPPRARRADLLARLAGQGLVMPAAMVNAAEQDPEGDLLDAIVLTLDPLQWVPPAEASVEGWIW
jgi:hypothetical protein